MLVCLGEKNSLNFARIYELTLRCDFELQRFPFDSQKCYIQVKTSFFKTMWTILVLTINNFNTILEIQSNSVIMNSKGRQNLTGLLCKHTIIIKNRILSLIVLFIEGKGKLSNLPIFIVIFDS